MTTSPAMIIERHIKVDSADLNAVSLLADNTDLSKTQIKEAMQKGAVWLTKGKQTSRLRRAKKPLKIGDELHLYYNAGILNETTEPAQLLFDQTQYSIWYKPYGMRCQGSKWSDHTTINRFVETQLTPPRNAYIIHRLDRAATGLIILGHTKAATAAIAKLFESRNLDKYYQVIVEGKFSESKITINTEVDGKKALSHAHRLAYDPEKNRSLVQVKIESGRKHQIRIHMASLGHSVVGDRLHGSADEHSINLQLTSCYFQFICPIENTLKTFELPQSLRPQL